MPTHLTSTICLLMSLLSLLGCIKTHSFYTGTFNGESYEVAYRETKGFSTNSIDYEVKLGRWKWVKIDPTTTDWGPPYADDVYGNARRVYIGTSHPPYGNERDNAVSHKSTMLYLSPDRFNSAAFDQYATFMQQEWPKIDRQFVNEDHTRFPHIVGLVYGDPDQFTRSFTSREGNKTTAIKVHADGRILYFPDSNLNNDAYSGLSEKVQMPGRIIYVVTGKDAGLSIAQVRTYRNEAGKPMENYFVFREKPTTSVASPIP